jgi:hypothetical protein
VLPATPPATEPLNITVTNIKVHISSLHAVDRGGRAATERLEAKRK